MNLPPEEPTAGPWRVEPLAAVAAMLVDRARPTAGRPVVLAVDGRSSSGKTALSRRIVAAVPGAAVVHTDDIAWWHAAFDWADLLDAGVWVQSDLDELDRRNAVRVQAGEISPENHDSWMAEEFPFLAADRPWERADLIVAGTPPLPYDPATEVVVADPAAGRARR